jgi:hypothetical protein
VGRREERGERGEKRKERKETTGKYGSMKLPIKSRTPEFIISGYPRLTLLFDFSTNSDTCSTPVVIISGFCVYMFAGRVRRWVRRWGSQVNINK